MSAAAKIMRAIWNESSMQSFHGNGDRYWCVPAADLPDGDVDEATHTAADALEALAVPGVADALRNTLNSELFDFSDPVRAALATLAKIARGE